MPLRCAAAPRSGFNGATDFHRWKCYGVVTTRPYYGPASMGPPIFIGGNSIDAMASRAWIRASMGPPIFIGGNNACTAVWNGLSAGFNGATDFHRWKLSSARLKQAGTHKLQWGHRFSSVEMVRHAKQRCEPLVASMGPPIFIGGNHRLCSVIVL